MTDNKETMTQGSTYEREEVEVMGGDRPKIPKKALYAGIAVIAIGIVAILIYSFMGKPNAGESASTSSALDTAQTQLLDTSYSKEDIENLRAAGYTGTEIEKFQSELADVPYLLEEAKKKKEEYLQKVYDELNAKVMNSQSKEFKDLKEKTWLGGKGREVKAPDINTFSTESVKDIVDYIKIPARGPQLFVRIKLQSGEYAFLNVPPNRYCQLKDVGNMVVTYDVITFGSEKFVQNIMEVNVQ